MRKAPIYFFVVSIFFCGVMFSAFPYWKYSFSDGSDDFVLNIIDAVGFGSSFVSVLFVFHLLFSLLGMLSLILSIVLMERFGLQRVSAMFSVGFLFLSVSFGLFSSLVFSEKLGSTGITSFPHVGFLSNLASLCLSYLGFVFLESSL